MEGEVARKMIRNIVIEMFIAKTVQFIGDTVSESQRRKQSRRRGARGGIRQAPGAPDTEMCCARLNNLLIPPDESSRNKFCDHFFFFWSPH